jgi:hypothetical protein
VRQRREIFLLVVGTPTLICYICPSKMSDIPALGRQSSLAWTYFQVYTNTCLSMNYTNSLLIHKQPEKRTQRPTSDNSFFSNPLSPYAVADRRDI